MEPINKFVETKYLIKEKEGIVVCVLKFDYFGPRKVSGVAKLNPIDTWDEAFGKKLANARAHIKKHQLLKGLFRKNLDWAKRAYLEELRIYRNQEEQLHRYKDTVRLLTGNINK